MKHKAPYYTKLAPKTTGDITNAEYSGFQRAYEFFNGALFDGKLPHVLITLQRHANTRGYFSPDRFAARIGESTAHELAMNPDTFIGRDDRSILSTLAHEMAHVWQNENDSAPRRGYHDKEWGAKMEEIGLCPSDTGAEGGKKTGQHMTHYIVTGGKYDTAFKALALTGFKLNWQSLPMPKGKGSKSSKNKYTCPKCEQNAWAKPAAALVCGDCRKHMLPN